MTTQILNTEHQGLECITLQQGPITLKVARTIGPRVLSLEFQGRPNIFAELPGLAIELPDLLPYVFHGGHRLWQAPEVPKITYQPDDRPVAVDTFEEGVVLRSGWSAGGELEKSMRITLNGGSRIIVDHALTNHGPVPVHCAPWAITQLPTGGTVLLPQSHGPVDPAGVLPNRQLVFWPYSDINSPLFCWSNRVIRIQAAVAEGALKIGYANPSGWLGYWRAGTLFVKKASYEYGKTYPDMGSSSQVYCNNQFVELETLGVLLDLEPGQSASHTEVWEVFLVPELPEDEAGLLSLLERLLPG